MHARTRLWRRRWSSLSRGKRPWWQAKVLSRSGPMTQGLMVMMVVGFGTQLFYLMSWDTSFRNEKAGIWKNQAVGCHSLKSKVWRGSKLGLLLLWWTRCEASQGDQEVHHLAPAHLHHHNHLVKVTVIKKFLASPLHISSGVNPPPPMTSTYPQQQASAPPLHGHQYPSAGYLPQVYLTKSLISNTLPFAGQRKPPSSFKLSSCSTTRISSSTPEPTCASITSSTWISPISNPVGFSPGQFCSPPLIRTTIDAKRNAP